MLAMGLGYANAAPRVLGLADDFHMTRIHTGRRTAEMINHEAGGDGPDEILICESVSTDFLAITERESSIPEIDLHADPRPTVAGLVDVPPETISIGFPRLVNECSSMMSSAEASSHRRSASALASPSHHSTVYRITGG